MISEVLGGVFIIVAIVGGIGLALKYWPRSAMGEFSELYTNFVNENQDVTFAERQAMFRARTSAARLRRRASEATEKYPAGAEDHIQRIAKDEAMSLAAADQDAARMFTGWVETAEIDDILYPKAFNDVFKQAMKPQKVKVDPDMMSDMIGALKQK